MLLLTTSVGDIGLHRQPSRARALCITCSVRKARPSGRGTCCRQKQLDLLVSTEIVIAKCCDRSPLRSWQPEGTHTTSTSRQAQALARSSAALLIAGGLLLGTPSLTPPAQAESAAETRRAAAEQRRALLNKTCARNGCSQFSRTQSCSEAVQSPDWSF